MNKRFWYGLAAYLFPTFALGFVWHLVIFAQQYDALQVYRPDLIFPFGIVAMLIQGSLLSWLFPRLMPAGGSWLGQGLKFGLLVGLFAWSYSTMAVAAKHVMTSVPLFVALETGFTIAHFAVVGPLIALAHRR
ncbi:MAG: hypothetical protein AB7O50_02410 [Pseudolabrys sp.]